MKIYQVLIGKIPEYLNSCVKSVENYCKRSNNEHCVISTVPDWLLDVPKGNSEYLRNRLIKDWLSVETLSTEHRVMFVDWDVFLYDSFCFTGGCYPVFAGYPVDCMMYNGDNLKIFRYFKENAGIVSDVKPGEVLIHSANVNSYKAANQAFIYDEFDHGNYKHLVNCRLMQ